MFGGSSQKAQRTAGSTLEKELHLEALVCAYLTRLLIRLTTVASTRSPAATQIGALNTPIDVYSQERPQHLSTTPLGAKLD
eukprot:8155299-Pyramimonas_sp.AAC.1